MFHLIQIMNMTVESDARYPVCLSIAGSDPSGGAGIQADLKVFSALGCYGAAAITALTVQNTCGVSENQPVEASMVYRQARAVMEDLRPDVVKIGMTCRADTICAVAELLREFQPRFTVLDPVMVSSSGHPLLDDEGRKALIEILMPLCRLVTPNLQEAACFAHDFPTEWEALKNSEQTALLLKGGHLEGAPEDVLHDGGMVHRFLGHRIESCNTHGTGCALSSAIAAFVARGCDLAKAVEEAKRYVEEALASGAGVCIGEGTGPMNHFFNPLPMIIRRK